MNPFKIIYLICETHALFLVKLLREESPNYDNVSVYVKKEETSL